MGINILEESHQAWECLPWFTAQLMANTVDISRSGWLSQTQSLDNCKDSRAKMNRVAYSAKCPHTTHAEFSVASPQAWCLKSCKQQKSLWANRWRWAWKWSCTSEDTAQTSVSHLQGSAYLDSWQEFSETLAHMSGEYWRDVYTNTKLLLYELSI